MYVSPDMAFISGVTDISTGLLNNENVYVVNSYNGYSELSKVETTDVLRQGRISYKEVLTAKTAEHDILSADTNMTSGVTAKYFEYNGDICYVKDNKVIIGGKVYEVNNDEVSVDCLSFIEDGKVFIKGTEYRVDFINGVPKIRKNAFSKELSDDEYDYIEEDWSRVTKFIIRRSKETDVVVDDIQYGGYKHYVEYDGESIYAYDGISGLTITLPNNESSIITNNYGDDKVYQHHSDLPLGAIYIMDNGKTLEVQDEMVISSTGGSFVVMTTASDFLSLGVGSVLKCQSTSNITIDKPVEEYSAYTNNSNVTTVSGITLFGEKYYVEDGVADLLNNTNTIMVYDDKTNPSSGYTVVNNERLYLSGISEISSSELSASSVNKMYYSGNTNEFIDYGINSNYTITKRKGIVIGDSVFPVDVVTEMNHTDMSNGGTVENYYNVSISSSFTFNLVVTEKLGAGVYACYPTFNDDNLSDYDAEEARREICRAIVQNKGKFSFTIRNMVIDYEEATPIRYVLDALDDWKPLTVSDYYDYGKRIQIYRVEQYVTFNIPLLSTPQNNLLREDVLKNLYVNEIEDDSINNIIDMEKDVYYPIYEPKDNENETKNVEKLRFNLHFRTRNLDNWKVYKDDIMVPNQNGSTTSGFCNWFVTDYKFYKDADKNKLQRSSDLLGFLNFTDSEIRNQALKISKSFLRLSFYSTNNPHTQVLLHTSVIHLDEQEALAKYLRYRQSLGINFVNVKSYEETNEISLEDGLTSFSEPVEISSGGNITNKYLLDGARISSRLEVNGKHITTDSSEGYYLYMFRDYARRMHETTIYMRIDFSHAGVGQSFPMYIPMDRENNRLLSLSSVTDVEVMKEGISTRDAYENLYIPVHLKYDEQTNKYTYWFDDIYNSLNTDEQDDVFEFNLFEIKYKNEAFEPTPNVEA